MMVSFDTWTAIVFGAPNVPVESVIVPAGNIDRFHHTADAVLLPLLAIMLLLLGDIGLLHDHGRGRGDRLAIVGGGPPANIRSPTCTSLN